MSFENMTIKLRGTAQNPGLLERARLGELVLPRFQRSFVWEADRIQKLLCTVARNWPAGSILLASDLNGFAPQALEGMSHVSKDPRYWVLDGQQRLTSLALVYRGLYRPDKRVKNPRVVALDLGAVRSTGQVEPEHFEIFTHAKWARDFGTLEAQVKARKVDLKQFLEFEEPNPNYFDDWKKLIPDENERREFGLLKNEQLSGLFNYEFPATVIDSNSDWEMIVWIFTHVNKQAKPLQPWDLVHAKTWSPESPEFSLRESWADHSDRIGLPHRKPRTTYKPKYNVTEDDFLRAMKLVADQEEQEPKKKGLTTSKIVDADEELLRRAFADLPTTTSEVVEFLRGRAGVLPAAFKFNLTLPIIFAHRFETDALTNPEKADKVLHWYWAMTFSQRYDFGRTNTLVEQDAHELLTWIRSDSAPLFGVTDFWTAVHDRVGVFDPSHALRRARRGNESLVSGVLSLQVLAGALDWCFGEKLQDIPEQELQIHHIFPKLGNQSASESEPDNAIEGMEVDEGFDDDDAPLIDEEDEDIAPVSKDIVLNLTILKKQTNAKIRSHPPDQLVELEASKVPSPQRKAIESGLVDFGSLGSWTSFCDSRERLLTAALEERIPGRE